MRGVGDEGRKVTNLKIVGTGESWSKTLRSGEQLDMKVNVVML
jgi:hypothetical protein